MNTVDILLVDDQERNLDALEAILHGPDYRLLRAETADRALKLLLDHHVAAIVLDVKMPGVSGFELAKLIKGTRRFRQVPILFLTAYLLEDQDVIAAYGAGGVDYLTKPVNPQVLRAKVGVFADLFRKSRALAELNDKLEERVRERTAELQRSETALLKAARQKDEFLAILAHELRNPLAPLRTGLDLVQLAAGKGEPAPARTLAAMNRQLDHMVRLIDDLLDISRITRGVLELKKDRVDLAATVRTAIESVAPLIERRKQTLSVSAPASVFAEVDPTRIAQVLGNLLHNASKFTPEGGRIEIELGKLDGAARIRVTDSGVGIEADQLDRVFDMFARVQRFSANGEQGLGIGLALARRIAELHGGKLEAASEGEHRGSTFTLSLPAVAGAAQLRGEAFDGVPVGPLHKLRIVVVEDNPDVGDTLVDLLEDLGHEVWLARSGPEGVERIAAQLPDVVLCDLGLPDMDGLDVCRTVRGLELARRPVMVALTGWGRDDDRRRTRETGFDHHLVKPVAHDKLLGVLRLVRAEEAG